MGAFDDLAAKARQRDDSSSRSLQQALTNFIPTYGESMQRAFKDLKRALEISGRFRRGVETESPSPLGGMGWRVNFRDRNDNRESSSDSEFLWRQLAGLYVNERTGDVGFHGTLRKDQDTDGWPNFPPIYHKWDVREFNLSDFNTAFTSYVEKLLEL